MPLVYDDAEPTSQKLAYDDEPGMTVGGAVSNAGRDIKEIASSVPGMLKKAAMAPIEAPMKLAQTGQQLLQGKNFMETPVGGDLTQLGSMIKHLPDNVMHPYEHPVKAALDIGGLFAGAKGIMGEAAPAAEATQAASKAGMADEATRAGSFADDFARGATEAPKPVNLPPEAAQILKEAPQAPPVPPTGAPAGPGAAEQAVPHGATFQETVANLGKKIPQSVAEPLKQIQDFVSQKYGQAAANPGFKDIMGDAMIRRAQGMRFRELGGTPGQARILTQRIGEDGVRELMDIAKEKGITRSPIGFQRRAATEALADSSGKAIGGIRELAAKRGAVHTPTELVNEIRSRLDAEYLGKGMASGEKGAYMKALEDIKSAAKTPETLAKKITEMNRRMVKNKMTQPTGAVTDVANEASRLNNQLIKKYLSPKETEFYDKSLADFGASKIFKKLQSFEVGREMGGRAGVGGLWRNIKQGAMDMGGSKVMENFYDKFGPRLKAQPGISRSLPALGEGAIEDLLSALDNAIDEVAIK